MDAIKKITDVKSGSIKINLPASFHDKKVEVIILALDESKQDNLSLENLLLSAPVISDKEFDKYNKVRDWMGEWEPKKF